MNLKLKENRTRWFVLGQILLCVGLVFVTYRLIFSNTSAQGLGEDSQKNVDATKTALVGTADALLGPFPTATLPTRTPSATATATPLISATPTITRSVTPSLTSTRTPIPTFTPRGSNDSSSSNLPSYVIYLTPPSFRTATPLLPTKTPVPEVTSTPRPTRTPTVRPSSTPTRPAPSRTPTPRPVDTDPPPATNTNPPPPPTNTEPPPPPPTATDPPPPPPTATDPPAATDPPEAATQPPEAPPVP